MVKNILTQPHSYRVISTASTNKRGLLKSRVSSEFGEELGVGSVDNPSENPTSPSTLRPTILDVLILITLLAQVHPNQLVCNKQTNKTMTESLPI